MEGLSAFPVQWLAAAAGTVLVAAAMASARLRVSPFTWDRIALAVISVNMIMWTTSVVLNWNMLHVGGDLATQLGDLSGKLGPVFLVAQVPLCIALAGAKLKSLRPLAATLTAAAASILSAPLVVSAAMVVARARHVVTPGLAVGGLLTLTSCVGLAVWTVRHRVDRQTLPALAVAALVWVVCCWVLADVWLTF